ncbi:MAG TPA: hypothetical protein VHD60_04265 [Candidatus Saccharimonadales bacterium]|nr:hypothetical protein [Candidatus Saccharimonadales bacterium]
MAKTKRKATPTRQELDSVYLLKLVLYLIVGAQWIRFTNVAGTTQFPVPVGLIIGVLFASHDHFQIDRKIEYAVLLIAALVGFWSQIGIYITT